MHQVQANTVIVPQILSNLPAVKTWVPCLTPEHVTDPPENVTDPPDPYRCRRDVNLPMVWRQKCHELTARTAAPTPKGGGHPKEPGNERRPGLFGFPPKGRLVHLRETAPEPPSVAMTPDAPSLLPSAACISPMSKRMVEISAVTVA